MGVSDVERAVPGVSGERGLSRANTGDVDLSLADRVLGWENEGSQTMLERVRMNFPFEYLSFFISLY